MVALDNLTRDIQRLDTVGIDSTLRQPFGIGDLLRLSIEDLDEVTSDNLTLLLRVRDSCQVGKELLTGIHTNHVQAQYLIIVEHLLELVLAKHAMVDEDTGEVLAYRLV